MAGPSPFRALGTGLVVAVQLQSGETSRFKVLLVEGAAARAEELAARFGRLSG